MTTNTCMLIKINVMYEKIFILRNICLPSLAQPVQNIFSPDILLIIKNN